MLELHEIEYLVLRYRRLRQTIGPEMIDAMGRDENIRLRDEWLKEYNSGV